MRYLPSSILCRAVLITCVSAAALTGCGSNKSADKGVPDVASVQSDTPQKAGNSSAAPAGRPVIRPDTTMEEEQRMHQPYMGCLKEHGVAMRTDEQGLLQFDNDGSKRDAAKPEIQNACENKLPIKAPELDPDKNPYYADDVENFHRCEVERGVDLVKENGQWKPGPRWGNQPGVDQNKIAEDCQAKSFDGKKG